MDRNLKVPLLIGIPLLVFIGILYIPTWEWMYQRWTHEDSYSSHGFLIPLISLWLLYNSREQLRKIKFQGSWWGLVILFGGILLHTLSGISRIHFTSAVSIPITLYGLVILLMGKQGERWFRFPIFYLVFMIPFPLSLIANLTLELKLMASEVATMLMGFVGIVVVREGSILTFPETTLVVGDVCSGLRSLVSLIAFGVPFAYLIHTSRWLKLLVLLLLFPLAFLMNVLRVFSLGVIANFFGSEAATGTIHDASGLVVFALNLLILWAITAPYIKEPPREEGSDEETSQDIQAPPVEKGFLSRYSVTALLLVLAAWVSTTQLYQPTFEDETIIYTERIPERIDRWKSANEFEADRRTIEILETSDILFRHYRQDESLPVLLCIVYSASSNRKIAHPPEICYRGAGWEVIQKHKIPLASGFNANLLLISKGQVKQAVLYWYKFGKKHTGNYYYHQAHALLNFLRMSEGGAALVRLSTPIQDLDESVDLLKKFASDFVPEVNKHLP